MTEEPPKSAADPRPGGNPYYIDSTCEDCGTPLVLNDMHRPSEGAAALTLPEVWEERRLSDAPIWWDEWVCPECEDGLHMDWPDGEFEELEERMDGFDPENTLSLKEVAEELGLDNNE